MRFFVNTFCEINKGEYTLILTGYLVKKPGDDTADTELFSSKYDKANLFIRGILPYVEIIGTTHPPFIGEVRREVVKRTPFICNRDPVDYTRIYFNSGENRKKALNTPEMNTVDRANDDPYYYLCVARDHDISLAGWNEVTGFQRISDSANGTLNYICEAHGVREINPQPVETPYKIIHWDIETYIDNREYMDFPEVKNPKSSVWLIGAAVYGEKTLLHEWSATTILAPKGMSIQCDSEEKLIETFADFLIAESPDFVNGFNCGSYDWPFILTRSRTLGIKFIERLLQTHDAPFTQIWGKGASGIIRDIAYHSVYPKKIKISAEEFMEDVIEPCIPGMISFDTRILLKQMNSKEPKSSLNFYLEKYGIPSKVDISYKRLYEIRRLDAAMRTPSSKFKHKCWEDIPRNVSVSILGKKYQTVDEIIDDVPLAIKYCIYDAVACKQLCDRVNIMNDYRETARLTDTGMYTSIYNAGGVRVRNTVIRKACKLGIAVSNNTFKKKDECKYPGAYVLEPITGFYRDHKNEKRKDKILMDLKPYYPKTHEDRDINVSVSEPQTDRPCVGLDASSLYPNVINTYNLSPEKIVRDPVRAEMLRKAGEVLEPIEFEYNGELLKAWVIRHCNIPEKFGLYPSILVDLYAARSEVKKVLGKYTLPVEYYDSKSVGEIPTAGTIISLIQQEIEVLEGQKGGKFLEQKKWKLATIKRFFEEIVMANPSITASELAEMVDEFKQQIRYYNTKQLAIKVFMNTFYGVTGSVATSFFLVECAGGVTYFGRQLLRHVKGFVEEKNFRVLYGDTDSLYICAPHSVFARVDEDYVNGRISRLEYWTEMIEITMVTLDALKKEVDEMLKVYTSAKFLTFAYEEVLWPFALLGKKKYVGIKHEDSINLAILGSDVSLAQFKKSKALFIRGIDIVRRDVPGAIKDIAYRVLQRLFKIDSCETLRDIVEDEFMRACAHPFAREMYISSKKYKLPTPGHPGNPNVLRFVERMKELAEEHPEFGILAPNVGDRFEYIPVQKPVKYEKDFSVAKVYKGDIWEYPETFENKEYQNYLGYFLVPDHPGLVKGTLCGTMARLLSYLPELKFYEDDILHVKAISNMLKKWYCERYEEKKIHENRKEFSSRRTREVKSLGLTCDILKGSISVKIRKYAESLAHRKTIPGVEGIISLSGLSCAEYYKKHYMGNGEWIIKKADLDMKIAKHVYDLNEYETDIKNLDTYITDKITGSMEEEQNSPEMIKSINEVKRILEELTDIYHEIRINNEIIAYLRSKLKIEKPSHEVAEEYDSLEEDIMMWIKRNSKI